MPTRLILDTDIGTDVDDCLALAVILGSPEVQLEGVTCVYGDVRLRARMAMKLLRLARRTDVPVMTGSRQTLLGVRDIFWPGHEGKGLLEAEDDTLEPSPEHAVDYLVRMVMDNPGEIHLLAVGPLTNVALAFRRESELVKRLGHVTIMGGAARGPGAFHLPLAEHNFACDPEAAHVVLSAGAPTTLVPLDVTTRVETRHPDLDRIRGGGSPFHDAVARQVELYPRFATTGATFLHDPLAAAIIVRPDLVSMTTAHVAVETQGRLTSGASLFRKPTGELPANVAVALDVDGEAAERFMLERISQPLAP
ncbi:MAG TPA: nucleoside hydrolase [Thermomicrobiales bacterium]|nr:nucleoside hydrolase [Thermomicrobiales bacterium]